MLSILRKIENVLFLVTYYKRLLKGCLRKQTLVNTLESIDYTELKPLLKEHLADLMLDLKHSYSNVSKKFKAEFIPFIQA